jgi:hypothetical protein
MTNRTSSCCSRDLPIAAFRARSAIGRSRLQDPSLRILFLLAFLWGIAPLLPAKFELNSIPDFRFRVRVDKYEEMPQAKGPLQYRPTACMAIPKIDLAEGQWSEWVESSEEIKKALIVTYPNDWMSNLKAFPLVIAMTFSPAPERVTLSFEWEVQSKEGSSKGTFSATYISEGTLILLWYGADGKYRMGAPSEYNKRYIAKIDELKLSPEGCPKKLLTVDRFIANACDEAALEDGFRLMTSMGFNTLEVSGAPKAKQILAKYGVTQTCSGIYNPPGGYFDSDPGVTSDEALRAWAKKQAEEFRKTTGWDPKDVVFFTLADEPNWYFPNAFQTKGGAGNENYLLEKFRDYLQTKGLQPADVGATKWEEVKFLGRGGVKDLPSKRLYYWTMRFFPDNANEYFARTTLALEKAFSPGMRIPSNLNNFTSRIVSPGWAGVNAGKENEKNPDAAMGGFDWVNSGRNRAVNTLFTEDWFTDQLSFKWSLYSSLMRSGANACNDRRKEGDPPPIGFGAYVIGSYCTEDVTRRVLSLFGNGGKTMFFYIFGPEYMFPGNCWSENLGIIENLSKTLHMVGRAEDLMYPGQPWRTPVAIVAPQSAYVWDRKEEQGKPATPLSNVDYMAEQFNLFYSLLYANIPADFIDEAGLMDPECLKKFKVIYLTAPNLPAQAVETLKQWVSEGGILAVTAGAGQFDIYDEPMTTLNEVLGIQPAPHARLYDTKDINRATGLIKPVGSEGVPFRGSGFLEALKPTKAKVLAQSEKGAPVITCNQFGKGRAMVCGTLMGTAYLYHFQTDGLRDWVTWPIKQAGVRVPVEVNRPRIETPVLVSEKGLAVTLLNWTTDLPASDFQITVNMDCFPGKKIGKVTSIELGDIPFTQEGNKAKLTVPSLELADVLKVYWQ